MSVLAIDGVPCESGYIMLPECGVWLAGLAFSAESVTAKRVTLESNNGITLQGAIKRGDVFAGRANVQVRAGTGGLTKLLDAKHYHGVIAKNPIDDIMSAAGEAFAGNYPADSLRQWTRVSGSGGAQLDELARHLGMSWYVDITGQVHIEALAYPEIKAPSYELLSDDTAQHVWTLGVDAFWLTPRVTFNGKKIRSVVHEFDAGSARTKAYYS